MKRSINGIENDISKQMKSYGDFNAEQEQEIEEFAVQASQWIKQSRLPKLHDELQKIARDIESNGRLQDQTWQSTVDFMESPFALSKANGLVESVAEFVYEMSEENIAKASIELEQDYQENNRERDKLTPQKRDKKIAKTIKVIFAELGAGRSTEQVESAVQIFRQRRSWLDEEQDIENLAHRQFISVISDRSIGQAEFMQKFLNTWSLVESGSRKKKPEIWNHNVRVGLQGLNHLLEGLNAEERQEVAKNIRRYAKLFNSFSSQNLSS